ncbi:hypothetical protein BOW53_12150 [Solemya pervernicosa gill symbiont]|uniref:Thiamine phosphate synthase/TenI domain-containing protein n=2 Tax=Solemya pervernicosa gill symbiont TaxID=642797 RepID=A0A1T2L2L6_9GAMM|nr:hypothetical protein BOW53_12150 [Solemya pervernicosa gill symbiont]
MITQYYAAEFVNREHSIMTLPTHYLITPSPEDEAAFIEGVEKSLQAGTRLMQLKAKGYSEEAYASLAERVVVLARSYDCKVLLTGNAELVEKLGADGLHLDSKALKQCKQRPLSKRYLIAVSAHTLEGLQQGEAIGASFGVLSPVRYTKAHPDIEPIGWQGLKQIAAATTLPLYALGGVSSRDEAEAIAADAQGVAGNKGYWKD